MEGIVAFVREVYSDPLVHWPVFLLFLLPILDWFTGWTRALRDNEFQWQRFDVFVRTQIGGRSAPLMIVLLVGRAVDVAAPDVLQIPGFDLSVLIGLGLIASVPFLSSSVASIAANLDMKQNHPVPVE